jgi:CHAT domain-containing protein
VIDEDVTLHQYPWELLRNSNTKFWLAVQKNCPFYRRHGDCRKEPIPSKPLNILIVICNPKSETNQIIKNLPPIEVEKETEFLKSIFDPLVEQKIINYKIEEKGTWKNLESALNEEKYHVVHLIGHGDYIGNEFRLIMDGENEREWFITADKFNQNLRLNPLQLLVLISCKGGSFNDKFGTKGLGPTLVDKGIPYVVAMQEPVSFYEAQQFSQLFYKYLTEYRYVDIAMALTRSALQQDPQLNLGNEWAIPVLFMGTDRGELFS